MQISREPAVMLRDLSPGSTAPRVTQKREILAGGETDSIVHHRQLAKLDEVIAAAAGSELTPRAILQLGCQRRDPPVAIHDLVLARSAEGRTDAESRFALDRMCQARGVIGQRGDRQIEY